MSKQVELSAGGVLMDDDGRKLTVAALAPTGGTTGDVPTVQANGTIALATPSATSADTLVAHGNTGAAQTFDASAGNVHTATLNANCTFTFTGATAGVPKSMTLLLTQDATGGRTVTWPASVVWPGNVAPTLTITPAAVDSFDFLTTDGGTTWYASPAQVAQSGRVTFENWSLSTNNWPLANRAYFSRVFVPTPTLVRYARHRVGLQSGNIQVGIGRLASDLVTMTRVAHTGVVACPASNTNVAQDMGLTLLQPGPHVAFMWCDNTTAFLNAYGPSTSEVQAARQTALVDGLASGVGSSQVLDFSTAPVAFRGLSFSQT